MGRNVIVKDSSGKYQMRIRAVPGDTFVCKIHKPRNHFWMTQVQKLNERKS